MDKDWIGNQNSIYTTIGASNHSKTEREANDYYATDPKALELLLEEESFNNKVWECACGGGHLSKVLLEKGYDVLSSDIFDRGCPNTKIINFLEILESDWILHSTRYGYWANEHTEISLSELDCIIEKCKELGWY